MADKALEDYLDDVLSNRMPVIPKLADLPSLWREASAETSDSSHSGDPDRLTWLAMYIDMADTKPWARDGLRGLLQELLENGEPVPERESVSVARIRRPPRRFPFLPSRTSGLPINLRNLLTLDLPSCRGHPFQTPLRFAGAVPFAYRV